MVAVHKIYHSKAKNVREVIVKELLNYIIDLTPKDYHDYKGPYTIKETRRVYGDYPTGTPDTAYSLYKGSTMKGKALVWSMYESIITYIMNWYLDHYLTVKVKSINYLILEYSYYDAVNDITHTTLVKGSEDQVKEFNDFISNVYKHT